jgi:hypothetical protein
LLLVKKAEISAAILPTVLSADAAASYAFFATVLAICLLKAFISTERASEQYFSRLVKEVIAPLDSL